MNDDVSRRANDPTLAILTFDCVDEWLDGLHLDLTGFASEMGCGWFNCLQAIEAAGVRCVLFGTSNKVARTTRFVHEPTGSVICLLPSYGAYDWIKGRRRGTGPDPSGIGLGHRVEHLSQKVASLATAYLSLPAVRFAREIKRDGCECILVEQYGTPRFDMAVFLGSLVGVPVYGQFAANWPGAERWVTRFAYPLRECAFGRCAGFVVCSSAEIERLRSRYGLPARKFANIPFPVDTSFWHPLDKHACRASLGIAQEVRLVVWHGGIDVRVKGLDILISAWAELNREHTEAPRHLVIIGDGSETGSRMLHRMLGERKVQGVTFIDRWIRDRELLRTYLNAADVYVFPSRSDAFGIAAAEAMACGCPVVVSSGAGVAELVAAGEEAGGLVVASEDAVALAAALRRLLADRELAREIGRHARRTVEATASMEAIARRMADFLFPHRGKSAERSG